MAPWQGPRHTSWASNTVLVTVVFLTLAVLTVVTDMIGEPPTYLVGLLGTAAGAWFGAIASDKAKRDQDVARTATRADTKADVLRDEHTAPKDRERFDAEVQRRTDEGSH